MKHLFILLFFMQTISPVKSQCKSGNCINGTGKIDFSWCVYEGTFVNGKPEGNGSITYDNYTYKGSFKNGMEDGDGVIIYKDGRKENVHYMEGQKVEGPTKLAAEVYKPLIPQDKNCVTGDCINGYGTYVWTSGNKYTGNWKNYKREGAGTTTSIAGDKFTGTWHNNEKVEGTYTFPNGAVYVGTYMPDGKELNGLISLHDINIPFVNGVARIPPAPQVSKAESGGNSSVKKRGILTCCRTCNGTGRVTDRIVTTTSYETTHYKSCPKCGGHGMWME